MSSKIREWTRKLLTQSGSKRVTIPPGALDEADIDEEDENVNVRVERGSIVIEPDEGDKQ